MPAPIHAQNQIEVMGWPAKKSEERKREKRKKKEKKKKQKKERKKISLKKIAVRNHRKNDGGQEKNARG